MVNHDPVVIKPNLVVNGVNELQFFGDCSVTANPLAATWTDDRHGFVDEWRHPTFISRSRNTGHRGKCPAVYRLCAYRRGFPHPQSPDFTMDSNHRHQQCWRHRASANSKVASRFTVSNRIAKPSLSVATTLKATQTG